MAVVARMRVTEIALLGYATRVRLTPEIPQEGQPHHEEVKAFYAATPTGQFEATIQNEVAAEQFQPGDIYYLSLEKASAS